MIIIPGCSHKKRKHPDFVQAGEVVISKLEDPLSFRGFVSLFCTSQHWPEFQQYHPEGCNTSWCSESYPPLYDIAHGKVIGLSPRQAPVFDFSSRLGGEL